MFTPDNQKFKNEKLSSNVFLYPSRSKIRALYFVDFLRIIKKILKNSGGKEIILTCQDPFETGVVGVLAKLFFGLPLHIQIHTDFESVYFRESSLLNKIRFFVAEFVVKYSNRVRVVSERIKKGIRQFSNNIDLLPIKAEFGADSGEAAPKPFLFTLLMVCRLEKEKNIESVFAAIKQINNPDIGLCIVGDGSERGHLEQLAKNFGIADGVFFAGWQNNLSAYYKMADLFVSASLYEGYGLSTVEAAYFAKSLVLSETGVAGEIFGREAALVCDAKDSDCLARSILKIYQNPDLAKKMGEMAKIAADKHLNSEKNYLERYAASISKAALNFKSKNFISRITELKITAFNSFRVVRYFLCGITAAAANIGSLYVFTDVVGIWYLYSSVLSFLLSLLISFTLQKFVVFKDMKTDRMHRQFSKFFVAAVLGVTTNTILMFVCVEFLGIWYIVSQVIAGFFVMIQNFILYKFFIFNKE